MNYKYVIASQVGIVKRILDMIAGMGGIEAAISAIKNFNNKTASIRRDIKTKILIRLLCLYTGWTSERIIADPREAIARALHKHSSKNQHHINHKRKK